MPLIDRFTSVGLRSDLIMARGWGEVEDAGAYTRWSTAIPRGWFVTNCLVYKAPPDASGVAEWPAAFMRHFADRHDVQLISLTWDATDADPAQARAFAEAGFQIMPVTVLAADRLSPPARPTEGLTWRPAQSDADWEALARLSGIASTDPQLRARRVAWSREVLAAYRALAEAGHGTMLMGWLDGQVVGQVGLFVGDGMARLQWVSTHPAFQRRGICRTLLHAATEWAIARHGPLRLVAVTAADSPEALGAYQAAGYAPIERLVRMTRPRPQ